ncbi:MAG: hypothetical protein RR586_04220 [Cellulosilyticaceae bacterium]
MKKAMLLAIGIVGILSFVGCSTGYDSTTDGAGYYNNGYNNGYYNRSYGTDGYNTNNYDGNGTYNNGYGTYNGNGTTTGLGY